MEELIPAQAEAYARQMTSPEDALRSSVAADTMSTHPLAHMLSGHVQGKFLEMISRLLQPERILEIGTFTGYSALCLAAGLKENGRLHTIERREADAEKAKKSFEASPYREKIILHTGEAKQLIPTLQEAWDVVFIDADKTSYIDYYELILPRLNKNGLIIADNVLFHGEVLKEKISGKNAKAIHAFNEHIQKDARVEQVLLTVRDGLLLIKKW